MKWLCTFIDRSNKTCMIYNDNVDLERDVAHLAIKLVLGTKLNRLIEANGSVFVFVLHKYLFRLTK